MLATTVPLYNIHFDYTAVPDATLNKYIDALTDSLALMFKDHSKKYFEKQLKRGRIEKDRYVEIAKDLRVDEYERLRKFPLFDKNGYSSGLNVEKRMIRERPYGILAQRLVGGYRLQGGAESGAPGGGGTSCQAHLPGYPH